VGAIVDITETGSSLVANKLRVVDVILESTTRLVANKDAWADPQKRAKIENLAVLLRGAIEGKKKVGLKMNLPTHAVPALSSALPAEKSPTVSPLLDEAFCAVEVVVDENAVKDLVPLVRELGGTGIVTYPVNIAIHD
jgi:ATP phosphoribosyltransferase